MPAFVFRLRAWHLRSVRRDVHYSAAAINWLAWISPVVRESVILTDCEIASGAVVERAIIDKRVHIGENARIGGGVATAEVKIALVGKNSVVPAGYVVEAGAEIGTDVASSDYDETVVRDGQSIQKRRAPNEI